MEGNTYRFVCFSMSNEIITGTSGAILNASLTIGASVNTGSYEATITNIVVTKQDGTQLKLNDSKFSIVVTNVIKGDANGDGEVNVSDIVEIVNYIMGKPSANFVQAAADLNGDGEINVTDIVKVVSIIMDTNSSSAAMHRSALNGNLTLNGKGQVMTAMVQQAEQFTAAQFDIILGDGQEIDVISLNSSSDHCLTWKMTKEGTCRVVVYSLTNSAFNVNDGELMSISLKGMNGRVAVDKVILVAANSNTTGIGKMAADKSVGNWYTLDGRKMDKQPSKKGIYIKNGKKHVVNPPVAGDDMLSVEAVSMSAGETKQVAIVLNNPTHKYAAFQFDLVLPEGISIAKNNKGKLVASLNEDRKDDHTLNVSETGTNTYRLLAFSMTNTEFYGTDGALVYVGTDGALVYVTLQAAEGIVEGNKTATIQSQVFTEVSGEQYKWSDKTFQITIEAVAPPITITAKNYSREYGEDNPTFEYTVTGGAITSGMPTITCSATKTSPVGTYDILIEKGTVSNKTVELVKGTLTITKAPLSVKAGTYTKKQGEDNPQFTLTYDGWKNNETEAVLTKKPTATTTATKASAPGEYEVKVSGGEAKNYELSYTNGKLIVTQADAVVITAKSYTRVYGDANPRFEYTSEGATLVGTPEITCEATATSPVGTYPIVIKKGSVTNYNDTYVNGTLTITKAPLAVKAGTYTKKQGEENPEFTLTYEGWKNNETEAVLTKKPTATTTATKASAPGEYEVKVSGGEAKNYELSYTNGKLIVTEADAVIVTAKSYTRTYGDSNPTFEYEVNGATLVGVPEITCEATATSPVGTYPIIIKKGNVTNYNDTYINGVLTITKAPLSVKAGTYTKKQGEDNPEFTLSYEGFKNNETESVLSKKPTATTMATKESAPGEYAVTVSGGEAQNYEMSYTNGKLIVTEADAVIVTAKSYTRKYGDANPTFEYEVSGATLVGVPEITCEATATSPVGTYPIVIKKGNVTNYNDTYVNGVLTITKAPLSVKAGTYTKKQGEENPEFTLTYEGFKNNETEAVLTKKPTATTTATKGSEPGEYEVTVSGGEAQNYELSYT